MTTPPSTTAGPEAAAPARTIHFAVLGAVFLTMLASLGVWKARQSDGARQIELAFSRDTSDRDASEIAERLGTRAQGLSDAQLDTAAQSIAATHSPTEIRDVSSLLRRRRGDLAAGKLGVYISEKGAVRYEFGVLYEQAGREYYRGVFVERDFEKAMRYLGDPSTYNRPAALHTLGLVMLDQENPARDPVRGLALIREAAEAGSTAAVEWLQKNGHARTG